MVATELNEKHVTSAQADANFSATPGNLPSHKLVYWHRDLPPLDAELLAEHTVEATSGHVPGTLSHRDDLWDGCYQDLLAHTEARLAQEIARFVEPIRDARAENARIHFRYALRCYRQAYRGRCRRV